MKISEISPEVATAEHQEPLSHLLPELEVLVKDAEVLPAADQASLEPLAAAFQRALSRLKLLQPFSDATKLHIWKLSYRLWNACVDLANGAQIRPGGHRVPDEHHARLRLVAADLLFLAGSPTGVPSPAFKVASFFYKTGLIWLDLRQLDYAASCFERATDLVSSVQVDRVRDIDERKLLLDINLARARTAWEASDRNLAVALMNRSKALLFGCPENFRVLAEQYLHFGKLDLLEKAEKPESGLSSQLLNEALDLCEKGIGASRRADQAAPLDILKARCLRFLAADRLQAEDYDGVLRCVRVMREGSCKEEHPSVGFMALKACLSLGKFADGEKELKAMVVNKSVGENVCVAAAESYLGAVGAEAAKGVLMGLLARCRLGARSAVRMVQKVAAGGGEGRAKVAAELVSDERVMALFAGAGVAKERESMHAVLWNCGAEYFRSKDHETAAELFEKSMLYLPRDEGKRARRANCYRVLCLCHLGLSRLDQAQEFIDEAEKIEPNINCAFLMLKVYLQKRAEKEAIEQVQSMVKCSDFSPEYLTLAAHEAMASRCSPVAVASLSAILDLYSPGKQMPMTEVAVLRNLISLLQQSKEAETDVLKYTKRARNRMSELGAEGFFGQGAVGCRELSWFAGNSWNMGLKSGADNKYGPCAEFLELASEFYGAAEGEAIESRVMSCKSLILSVGAMISGEEQEQAVLSDADIKKAMEMLEKARKVLYSTMKSTSSTQAAAPAASTLEPRLFFLHTLSAYRLLRRLGDDPQQKQLHLIRSFISSSKQGNPQDLLHLGDIALQPPHPNPEAASTALNACLSSLLASASPDYKAVGVALRKLVGLAVLLKGQGESDEAAFAAYQQAYRIIVGLKDGEYPAEEGKWLAMTAWNKAGLAIRLGQAETARKWMKMGLDLATQLRCMDSYGRGMEECLGNFDRHCGLTDPIDVG